MSKLKIKAKIYQYTGIYLAKKEEQAYVDQWVKSGHNIDKFGEGLIRGMWQSNNGFMTLSPIGKSMWRVRYSPIYKRIAYRLIVIYMQLKDDLGIR